MYYNVSQIKLPRVSEEYQRLVDMRPGDTLPIGDKSYVLLNIERNGTAVEPVYNLETSDLRASMRIVNGRVLITTVNKVTFEIKNDSIEAGQLGWVKRGGFYSYRRRVVLEEGYIRGRPLLDGDIFEIHKNSGRFGNVVATSGDPDETKREFILVSFNSPRDGKPFVETMFHSVKTEQNNYQLQKVCGDIVYVNNYMEQNLKHIA
ncbi:hypothetical protein phiAS5_ORF0267 [Aeromonas phage phiAS5]|uniref:Uncharacterized protein n=1 Tax=Aeromonas phage phiAS5 TaxID=879630 RepID=E1A221_9CAUD|nr:hypothetical protein phiAS5_ORF0267 [Aeromonas phage phiAS5]ADM80110.1 hypothetical protein phiAS5_ORF0267 [Aeromonas phage phiAS5]BES53127.1 hypothetical protein [Aeromonas phage phiWae14]